MQSTGMMGSEDDGVPLVGDIYRKCAAFFSEIDNIISLESFEYAENQLRIAGATAKEACSKFMQETLPDFLTNSSQEASPVPEENGCYEVQHAPDKDQANGHIISSSSSTEGDDLAGEKDMNKPNVTVVNDSCNMFDETKMVVQPTPKMHVLSTGLKSISAMAIEKKCDCPDDHDASACLRRKHQTQNSEESKSQDEDFCESDWEII